MTAGEFVRRATRLAPVGFVPEISVHQTDDLYELWAATERARGQEGLPPPFWAVAWPGGQALARYLLDHPDLVAGRSVFDFGSGSGLVAIAAARAGAARVTAGETDQFAVAAIEANAAANGVAVSVRGDAPASSLVAACPGGLPGLLVAGDVWYEKELADQVMALAEQAARLGAQVLAGDIGRTYFPRARFQEVASYQVPASRALESAEVLRACVWRVNAAR